MPTFDWECPNGHQFERFVHTREEPAPECLNCGASGSERIWAITKRNGYGSFPYTTKHFNGKEITVTDAAHERVLMKEFNVRKRDDVAYTEQIYEGWDFAAKKQRYREPTGMGMKGCWF